MTGAKISAIQREPESEEMSVRVIDLVTMEYGTGRVREGEAMGTPEKNKATTHQRI